MRESLKPSENQLGVFQLYVLVSNVIVYIKQKQRLDILSIALAV